jgi:peptidoglycan/LPS O-acetylase OafA/YrhL
MVRSAYIDFLRGLAVLGILIYHVIPNVPVGLGQGSMEFFL